NMGIRFLLFSVYLQLRDLDRAKGLLKRYDDEQNISFTYGQIILEYVQYGITLKLRKLFNDAVKYNPHVLDYMFGRKPLPDSGPEYIGVGDENEAVDYVFSHAPLWADEQLEDLIVWMDEQKIKK